MRLDSEKFGVCDAQIYVDSFSSVDSFIKSAYSEKLDRELTDDELLELQEDFEGEVQEYAYMNGSRNHN